MSHYKANQDIASQLLDILRSHILGDKALKQHIHSVKSRVKDPKHLKDKLERKLLKALKEKKKFTIDNSNLFVKINDLAGFRILHLHTRQLEAIHEALLALFTRERYVLREKPFARTWDDESRAYFRSIGIKTRVSPSMYTSVHYVINSNHRQIKATCEIQVRTLMEEVWGEVDHAINYPTPSRALHVASRLKRLRVRPSSATRLVDSIFSSYDDHVRVRELAQKKRRKRKQADG